MLCAALVCLASCKNASERELQQQVDSLQAAYTQRTAEFNDLQDYVYQIADGLDSIAQQEGQLFSTSESPTPTREQIKRNLTAYQQTLEQQRQRIGELEKKLSAGNAKNQRMQIIVNALKSQLEQKDAEVKILSEEVNNKNANITSLKAYIERLRQRNQRMADQLTEQESVMASQEQQINQAYIKIGPKEELKKLGLVSGGGLLKKSKVDYSSLDKSLFSKRDIRKLNHIEMLSKKAKVLTPQPTDSYTIEEAEGNAVLVITNPKKFWSVTNYLIIQTN